MKMLEVQNVSVRYGDYTVLDDLSFSIEAGQWLMIVGPNGAGKSTVVKAVSGGAPYEGTIRCLGKDIKTFKPVVLARIIGVLAQSYHVGYSFSVEEVIRMGRYAHSKGPLSGSSDEDDAAVERAIELTGLRHLLSHSVLSLSGGELQRTFLAQVFAQNPQILILDEPTNHLDLVYQKQVFELIEEWLKQPDRAIISVVHDLSLAKSYGSETLLLDKGKAVASGATEETLTPANLTAVYNMDVYDWMHQMLSQWQKEE